MPDNSTGGWLKGWRLQVIVWTLRVLVGGLFVMSGLVKGVDLWGFVFKIEEYLAVWGVSQPRSLVVMAALLVSGYEFVFGFLLAVGCYKRVAVWALAAQMVVMLPLTAYIAVVNPVSDCGCFGDFWVISNTMTFVKNLLLSAALVFLMVYNPRLKTGVYEPAIQWLVTAWVALYMVIVGLYGYNVQPMLDFRPYPVGVSLIAGAGENGGEAEEYEDESTDAIRFIYERDGERREFTLDNLPDSTWTFIDRIFPGDVAGDDGASFTVYDDTGEEVTESAIPTEGEALLLVIPEPRRIDISYTYFLNELKQWADTSDVTMVCLIAADRRGIDYWKDVSMSSYEVYSAEDTKLKELARGTMSLVQLDNGIVEAKYTLSSIDGGILDAGPSGKDLLDRMAPDPRGWFKMLTGVSVTGLLALYLFQRLILAVYSRIRKLYRKKTVNLQSENDIENKLNHNKFQNNHEKEHRSR